jgi:ubiquinone/menaquinone biosynthesis C-methylase UbiE
MSQWKTFDAVAETYDRVRAPVHQAPAADVVDLLGSPTSGGLLDVATGTGVLAAAAQAAGWDPVVGIDRSVPMLTQAFRRGVRHLAASEVVDLPFRDSTFGALGVAFALHTFAKYDTALFDMLRVLRPDGRLGVATWGSGDDEFTRVWRWVAETFATKDLFKDALSRAAPWQERFSDPARLEEALRDAGLRNVSVERRQYRTTLTIDDYLTGRGISAQGRFLRDTLGEPLWQRFHERVSSEFRERFPDPLGDTNDVLIAAGTKD